MLHITAVEPDWQETFIQRAIERRKRFDQAARAAEQRRLQAVKDAEIARHVAEEKRLMALSEAERARRAREAWAVSASILLLAEVTRARLLANSGTRSATTAARIMKEVCAAAKVRQIDMESSRRTANVVFPRQFAMWRMKRETRLSLPRIGRYFGDRDHTTVLSACRKMDRLFAAGEIPAELVATLPPDDE